MSAPISIYGSYFRVNQTVVQTVFYDTELVKLSFDIGTFFRPTYPKDTVLFKVGLCHLEAGLQFTETYCEEMDKIHLTSRFPSAYIGNISGEFIEKISIGFRGVEDL